jgi:DNA-directed RNA polymerase beta' subunit
MKLDLLNINEFIDRYKLQEVTSKEIFSDSKNRVFDDRGLWSETIFGRVGSKERQSKFGFANLNTKIFHPVVYKLLYSVSEDFRDALLHKKKYVIKDKQLIENDSGETGIIFLCENIDNIDFVEICKKDKLDVATFLEKNKDKIVIDKYLIIPAGIRDLNISVRNPQAMSDPINEAYESLLNYVLFIKTVGADEDIVQNLQKTALNLHQHIIDRMKGKTGFMRGSMLKKSIDYSGRVVATSDQSLNLGEIGIPWHTVLTLYEPFFTHYVFSKDEDLRDQIKLYMEISDEDELSSNELKHFNLLVSKNIDNISETLKTMLIHTAEEITKDKTIIIKRDPATMRDHYYAAEIKVLKEGRSCVVPGLICDGLGLDFDGDTLSLTPLLTEKANKEAKKLNPKHNKSIWISPLSITKKYFKPQHDTIATIYNCTKDI